MTTGDRERIGLYQTWLQRISLIGVTLLFIMIVYGILFRVGIVEIMGEPLQILVAALGYALLLFALTSLFNHWKKLSDKQLIWILLGIHLVIVFVYIGTHTFEIKHEMQYINNAAIMIGSGQPLTQYLKEYFATFPSVFNTSYLLAVFYAIFHFLQLDQWASSLVPATIACFNAVICIPCVYSITKRFTNNRKASIFATLCYVLFPSILINSVVPYHFTLMFSIPILMLWLLIKIVDASKTSSKILFSFFYGLSCAFGMLLGSTPLIPFIALFLLGICQKEVRRWVCCCGLAIACCFGCLSFLSNHFVQENVSDEQLSDSLRTPNELYMLIALDEYSLGFYKDNSVSYGYSDYISAGKTTYAQRKEFLQTEIHNQLSKYSAGSFIYHYFQKITAEFDLGSFFGEWKENTIYNSTTCNQKGREGKQVLEEIPGFDWIGYDSLCQGMYLLVIICALRSIPFLWKHKEFLPHLITISLCGFALATTIWETNPRHEYLILPYIFVLAGVGFASVSKKLIKETNEVEKA